MKTLSKEQLVELLSNIHKNTFIGLVTETVPTFKCTGFNPYEGRVKKVGKYSVQVNFDYEKAVNNRRKKENKPQDFKAKPRVWGSNFEGPLLTQNGKLYLRTRLCSSEQPKFFVDNILCNFGVLNDLSTFLRLPTKTRQRLNNEVEIRMFSLDSIRTITVNSEVYQIDKETV